MKRFIEMYWHILHGVCLLLLFAWIAMMLAVLWFSGDEETNQALKSGKRYIINIESGKVEGGDSLATKTANNPEQKKPEEKSDLPEIADIEESEVEIVTNDDDIKRSATPIAEVNDELLEKKTANLSLPIISPSNLRPLNYYSKRYRRPDESPMVAIIITGLGHSKKTTHDALNLDERIGLSFSPYAQGLSNWAAASRKSGHEMYVDLPLQTLNYPYDDPGNYSITLARGDTDNIKHIHWAMSRFHGYVGMIAPPKEVVTNNNDSFAGLSDEIAKRGLMLVFGNVEAAAEAGSNKNSEKEKKKKTSDEALVTMRSDIWIDEELSEMSIQARLAMLEQVAQRNGYAVGIAGSYPLSIKQIKQWREGLETRGVTLTPLSFINRLHAE